MYNASSSKNFIEKSYTSLVNFKTTLKQQVNALPKGLGFLRANQSEVLWSTHQNLDQLFTPLYCR